MREYHYKLYVQGLILTIKFFFYDLHICHLYDPCGSTDARSSWI